jgi:hypothetical protein
MDLEFANILHNGRRTGECLKIPLSELKNHVLLVGGSGSGKTHFARVMIEDILTANVPTIVIDSQGDLLWLTRVKQGNSAAKRRLRAIEKQVFTPASPDGKPFVIAPVLYSPTPENNILLIRYWIRSVLRAVGYGIRPGQSSPEEYHLTQASLKIVRRSGGLSLKTLFGEAKVESSSWTIHENAPIAPEDAKLLTSRLGALLGNEPQLYDGSPFSVTDIASSRRGNLCVIYLVPLPTETRQLILNWLCESIYEWMMNTATGASDRPRLLLFIDEAADYLTESNLLENRQALYRLLNQGRKYGVGLILAVQSPKFLPPEVHNNCKIKVFGALDDPGDFNYVRDSTGLRSELNPLRDREWNHAFVVRVPGSEARFCRARDLLTRNGKPLAPRSPGMTRILRLLDQE